MSGSPSATEDLVSSYNSTGSSSVSVMKVSPNDVSKYGMADVFEKNEQLIIKRLVEKPKVGTSPSLWALPGRYVLNPEIFRFIKDAKPSVGGEIQLTDALDKMAQTKELIARPLQCQRYDAGDKLGYLIANIEIGLSHGELGSDLKSFLISKAQQLAGGKG